MNNSLFEMTNAHWIQIELKKDVDIFDEMLCVCELRWGVNNNDIDFLYITYNIIHRARLGDQGTPIMSTVMF